VGEHRWLGREDRAGCLSLERECNVSSLNVSFVVIRPDPDAFVKAIEGRSGVRSLRQGIGRREKHTTNGVVCKRPYNKATRAGAQSVRLRRKNAMHGGLRARICAKIFKLKTGHSYRLLPARSLGFAAAGII